MVGPTLLSRISRVEDFFIQASSAKYYQFFSFICRMLFMFSIGLETDLAYLKRNIRVIIIVAGAGSILACIFSGPLYWLLIKVLRVDKEQFSFYLVILTILANTASPIVIRMLAESKFDTADLGRLALNSSLINEMSCVAVVDALRSSTSKESFGWAILVFCATASLVFVNSYLSCFFNSRNRNNRFITNGQVFVIIFLLASLSFFVERVGYTAMAGCFFIGLLFPREGKTARTLLHKLSYAVNSFILPVYFGYTGFQFDLTTVFNKVSLALTVLVISVSVGTKIIGTFAACHYLKIPWNEGLILSFLLNLKGNYDLVLMSAADPDVSIKLHLIVCHFCHIALL